MKTEKRIALFTGTFDPFTIGHQNVVDRTLPLFDKIVIAVAVSKLKHTSEEIDARVKAIEAVYKDEERVEVKSYDDLTVDMARRESAHFIVRASVLYSCAQFVHLFSQPVKVGRSLFAILGRHQSGNHQSTI